MSEFVVVDPCEIKDGDMVRASVRYGGVDIVLIGEVVDGALAWPLEGSILRGATFERQAPDWSKALVIKVNGRLFGRADDTDEPWTALGGGNLYWYSYSSIEALGDIKIIIDENGKVAA
jgi:hypothetical protein